MAVFATDLLHSVLAEQLSAYVEDLDKDKIQLGLRGTLLLTNLKLRKDCLQQFNLLVRLKSGMIGKLKLNVSFTQVRLDLELEDVYVVAAPWNEFDEEEHASASNTKRIAALDLTDAIEATSIKSELELEEDARKGAPRLPQPKPHARWLMCGGSFALAHVRWPMCGGSCARPQE